MYLLSRIQAAPVLDALKGGEISVSVSLDLNLSTVELAPDGKRRGVLLPDGALLTVESLKRVAKKEDICFVVDGGEAEPVTRFSQALNRSYSLKSTTEAPTLLIAGFPMHRIKGTTPNRDTEAKFKAIGNVHGSVLDTTTGLGYTAVAAARTASEVVTIELDPEVLEVARTNPWSAQLFENPRIRQLVGDSSEVIRTLRDASFDLVLHDPPTLSLGGDLYSLAFYREAVRVLRSKGRLFHYIGDLDSRHGRVVSKGVVKRLQEAGFVKVARHPEAFALTAAVP